MANDDQTLSLRGKAALVLGATFVTFGLFAVGLVMPVLRTAFANSPQAALVPWVATLVGPAFALSSPVAGYIIEKYGYRRVYIYSIVLFALAGSAPMLLDNLWLILPLRILLGFGVAGAMTASLDGIGRQPAAQRPTLFGLQAFLAALAGVFGFPLIGYLARSGWHQPFAIYLGTLAILPLAIALPRISVTRDVAGNSQRTTPQDGVLAGLSTLLVLFGGTIGLIIFIAQIYSPIYLASIGVTNPAHASIAVTTMSFTAMILSSVYGFVHRRLGTNGIFVISLICFSVALTWGGLASSLASFTGANFILGIALGIGCPNVFTWAIQNSDASPGRVCGFVNSAFYLTPVAFPLFAPLIVAHGGPGSVLLVFAAVSVVWLVWFTFKAIRPLTEIKTARALRSRH
jgi:MFS family permease